MGLGCDGYITDMFEVMRGAFLIHKAHRQDPRVMPANLVWQLATEGGAHALGLEKVGRLAPGWQADLQLIDSTLPTPVEAWNLYDQLLLYRSRRDVRAVMVAGQWRVRDGEVLGVDEELRCAGQGSHGRAERSGRCSGSDDRQLATCASRQERRLKWPICTPRSSASPCRPPSSWPPARCPMMRPGCGRRIGPARGAS